MTDATTLARPIPARGDVFPLYADDSDLMNADQMAAFAADGFVGFDDIVPSDLNARALADMAGYEGDGFKVWPSSSAIRDVFFLPRVSGVLRSLLGPSPVYNHSFLHIVPAHHDQAQYWHADSVMDTRDFVFDILVLYFPQDTPEEMGPTLVLPGSHLRKVRYGSLAGLRSVLGQKRLVCTAGTIFFVHADIWHAAQPNSTDRPRYMFKLRLQPAPGKEVTQRGSFNLAGYDSPEILSRLTGAAQPWYGAEHREEQIQHAKFWRYLTGDDTVDTPSGHLRRLGV